MPNPTADFPTSLHTATDISAFASTKLGQSTPTHTDVEGKQEAEIRATQTKVGITSGANQSPTVKKVLVGSATAGTSAWQDVVNAMPTPVIGFVLGEDGAGGLAWVSPSAGAGENNTASNVGTAGVGVYKSKTGVNLNLKNIEGSDGKITVTNNTTNDTVDLSVNQASLNLPSIGGTLTIAKGGTGQTAKAAAYNALSPATTLGDVEIHDGTNIVRLAGNTTTTRKFFRNTGNGTVSSSPVWDTLVSGDIPNILAAKVTDFQATAQAYTLDTFAPPAASVNMNSQKLVSVLDPTSPQDAATKYYVDAIAQGLQPKAAVRVVIVGNVTISSVATSQDGVTLVQNDRVLLTGQTTASQNGIYTLGVVTSGFAPLTRSTDADVSSEVLSGMYSWVQEGTVYADTGWVLTTDGTIVLGTTSLSFTQFSGAGQITAGTGLTKTGNTLNVGAGTGITVNADDIQISAGYTGQSSITTLGAVTSATWQATAIAAGYGGTGNTAYTKGDILGATGASALGKLGVGTDGKVLVADSTQTTGLNWQTAARNSVDAVVATSGADYTTLTAAVAGGAKRIGIKGVVTLAAAVDLTNDDITLVPVSGDAEIAMTSTSFRLTVSGNNISFSGIKIRITSTTSLASNSAGWIEWTGSRGKIIDCFFELTAMTTATTGTVIYAPSAQHFIFNGNHINSGAKLRTFLSPGVNRSQIISNNMFVGFSDMSAIWINTSANAINGLNITGNNFYPTAMTDSKNIIHLETAGFHIMNTVISDNVVQAVGTYASGGTGRDCLYLKSNNNAQNQEAGTLVSNNIFKKAGQVVTDFGVSLGSIAVATLRGNVIGTLSAVSGNTAWVTLSDNFMAQIDISSGTHKAWTISGNTFNGGNMTFSNANNFNITGNNQYVGSGGLTLNSGCSNCVIASNGDLAFLNVSGNYHTITGNKASGTAAPSGTLTLAGTFHKVYNNQFSSISNSATGTEINGRLFFGTTSVGNLGVGEDNLMTASIPANQMIVVGDTLDFSFSGSFAANANSKQVKAYFGTSQIAASGANTTNGGSWQVFGKVIMISTTTQEIQATIVFTDAAGTTTSKTQRTAGTQTLTAAVTMKCTGEAVADNDITQTMQNIMFVSAV